MDEIISGYKVMAGRGTGARGMKTGSSGVRRVLRCVSVIMHMPEGSLGIVHGH